MVGCSRIAMRLPVLLWSGSIVSSDAMHFFFSNGTSGVSKPGRKKSGQNGQNQMSRNIFGKNRSNNSISAGSGGDTTANSAHLNVEPGLRFPDEEVWDEAWGADASANIGNEAMPKVSQNPLPYKKRYDVMRSLNTNNIINLSYHDMSTS